MKVKRKGEGITYVLENKEKSKQSYKDVFGLQLFEIKFWGLRVGELFHKLYVSVMD